MSNMPIKSTEEDRDLGWKFSYNFLCWLQVVVEDQEGESVSLEVLDTVLQVLKNNQLFDDNFEPEIEDDYENDDI